MTAPAPLTASAQPAGTIDDIPADLRRMHGRPFGRDEHGEPIAHGSGRIVVGSVRYLQARAGAKAEHVAIEVPGLLEVLGQHHVVLHAVDAHELLPDVPGVPAGNGSDPRDHTVWQLERLDFLEVRA